MAKLLYSPRRWTKLNELNPFNAATNPRAITWQQKAIPDGSDLQIMHLNGATSLCPFIVTLTLLDPRDPVLPLHITSSDDDLSILSLKHNDNKSTQRAHTKPELIHTVYYFLLIEMLCTKISAHKSHVWKVSPEYSDFSSITVDDTFPSPFMIFIILHMS